MSYRGHHERDYIELDTGWDLDRLDSYYIEHEEKNPNGKGNFFVVSLRYFSGKHVVGWRPSRNALASYHTFAMTVTDPENPKRKVVESYSSMEDAIASIPFWAESFEVPEHYTRKNSNKSRDSQKSKVYKWEHKMAFDIGPKIDADAGVWPNTVVSRDKLHQRCTPQFLRNMLEHICINLGEKVPALKFRKSGSHSFGGTDIRLLPVHCNRLILLHELAHVLHRRWGNTDDNGKLHAGHGKEFVGIYVYLLTRFGEVDLNRLTGHLREYGIKYELPIQFSEWLMQQKKAA